MSHPQETSQPDDARRSCAGEDDCCCPPEGASAEPWKEEPGAMLGPYRLLQRIGEGGFGVVYMAEQREPVRRKVALKLIKPGMDTQQVIARFEAERQALAMMDHPNIARVLDAGTTRQARPFFVMELVKGVPITTYCDTENLTMQQRLELFCQVCRAVQHAHQKGIIHRDLKPSNVLVTLHDSKPVPKVIDFGIAKATNVELTARTLFTEFRQFIGTPEYMSPEQAEMSGLDIDTRSDIYSLGVLLYELLTGTTPFDGKDLRSAALDEIQRIIREEEPPRPSTRVSSLLEEPSRFSAGNAAARHTSRGSDASLADAIARRRRTDPQHLKRQLKGDLDWIIMKTLEKDRTRRYDTAAALADDIERHLHEQPVLAGPPSTSYRMKKFYRRNKGRVLAAAAVGVVFLAGLVGTSTGMVAAIRSGRAAELEKQKAIAAERATSDAMAETDLAMKEARQQAAIAQAVNSFLNENLLASVAPDEAGKDVTVLQVLERAAEQIDEQFADQPAVQATLHHTIGKAYTALDRYSEAERHLERSLQIRRREFGDLERETILAHGSLGALYLYQARYADAEGILSILLERAQQTLGPQDEATLGLANNLAVAHLGQGEFGNAERLLRSTLETLDEQGRDHPHAIKTLGTLGNLAMDAGRTNEAEAIFDEVLQRQRRVLGEDHIDTLVSRNNLAMIYRTTGRLDEAEEILQQVLAARRQRLGNDHSDTFAALVNLALVYKTQDRDAEAEPLLMEAVDIGRRVLGDGHPHVQIAVGSLAEVYEKLGRLADAEALMLQALDGLERALGMINPETLSMRSNLMEFYRRNNRSAEVERLAADHVRALKRAAERPDATPDTLNTAAYELVTVEPAELRDGPAAVGFAQRACELTGNQHPYFLDTLACALAESGQPARAVEVQKQALAITPEDDPGRPEMMAHLRRFEEEATLAADRASPASRPSAAPASR